MLSLFELKAILLISSVKTLCLSLLNFCCVFNINLLFFTLREKCPNTELFLVRIFMYLFQLQENTERNKSVFGHFSRSVIYSLCFVTKETNHFFFLDGFFYCWPSSWVGSKQFFITHLFVPFFFLSSLPSSII